MTHLCNGKRFKSLGEALAHAGRIFERKGIVVAVEELQTCDDCGAEVPYIIGCPDGAEICQQCFDNGGH